MPRGKTAYSQNNSQTIDGLHAHLPWDRHDGAIESGQVTSRLTYRSQPSCLPHPEEIGRLDSKETLASI